MNPVNDQIPLIQSNLDQDDQFSCFFTISEDPQQSEIQKTDLKQRKRIPFTESEDRKLIELVQIYGIDKKKNWKLIANNMIGRNVRQCRERYNLFLSQNVIKKAKWTKEEEDLLLEKYEILGPHWKKMEVFFKGRNLYSIKNKFISLTKKMNKKNSSHKTEKNESLNNLPSTVDTSSSILGVNSNEVYDYQKVFFGKSDEFQNENDIFDYDPFNYYGKNSIFD